MILANFGIRIPLFYYTLSRAFAVMVTVQQSRTFILLLRALIDVVAGGCVLGLRSGIISISVNDRWMNNVINTDQKVYIFIAKRNFDTF